MDVESLGAAPTMKPFWSAGFDCYLWIESAFIGFGRTMTEGLLLESMMVMMIMSAVRNGAAVCSGNAMSFFSCW